MAANTVYQSMASVSERFCFWMMLHLRREVRNKNTPSVDQWTVMSENQDFSRWVSSLLWPSQLHLQIKKEICRDLKGGINPDILSLTHLSDRSWWQTSFSQTSPLSHIQSGSEHRSAMNKTDITHVKIQWKSIYEKERLCRVIKTKLSEDNKQLHSIIKH